ncbi:2-dehydro-3-deoxyphosphooctonate aldolase [Flavobacterium sp. 9AF]|uniref:DUF1801 domain-containing protein n=1 Tax=Flavobacterium sp. 9AF TaxID=2653142 RepID=UPI0012F2D2B1|nr:DUF1801 domain-containing protein [Flavobacterium sp. 9AF]VXC26162.1 2-dehydro-3-deoxyphosphooctonate aldolase [Flavobacterium sp. 9AF]
MKPVEEYIFRQPESYREMLLHIIAVVEKELKETELLFKWGIPYFYYKKKPFCYLAPNHKKKFVDVGFAKGFQLKKNMEFLVDEKRNTVKSLRYYKLEEIANDLLISVIEEAKTLY